MKSCPTATCRWSFSTCIRQPFWTRRSRSSLHRFHSSASSDSDHSTSTPSTPRSSAGVSPRPLNVLRRLAQCANSRSRLVKTDPELCRVSKFDRWTRIPFKSAGFHQLCPMEFWLSTSSRSNPKTEKQRRSQSTCQWARPKRMITSSKRSLISWLEESGTHFLFEQWPKLGPVKQTT